MWVIGRNYEWRFIHQEGFGQFCLWPLLSEVEASSLSQSVSLLGIHFMDEVCSFLFSPACPIWLMNLCYQSRTWARTFTIFPFNFHKVDNFSSSSQWRCVKMWWCTVFEIHQKCLTFCLIINLSGNTVWTQAPCPKRVVKTDHFWHFYQIFVHSNCNCSSLRSQC